MALKESNYLLTIEKKRKKLQNKKSKKNKGKIIKKKGPLGKNKKEKKKLDELYSLEIKNLGKRKNEECDNDGKASDNSDFLNNDYDDIKEITKQVKEQVNLHKLLLRTRILIQKVLSLSNKLPLLPFVSYNEQILNNREDKNDDDDDNNLHQHNKNLLREIQLNEHKLKDDIGELLTILHNFLKKYFIKLNIPINEKAYNEINIICDEEDKPFYENRTKLYEENTTESEKKLFSLIDTWFTYSKKMCLNFFDIMHKITKISSVKSLKTYEQPISSQINQVMFDFPSIIESSYPRSVNHNIIGKKLYELLYADTENFYLNKYLYDDEVYYKKFLLNAIQNLKDNQQDNELLKSQKELYKIKKICNIRKSDIYLPEPSDSKSENPYDYMDNPELVNVLLSSLFQD
ncbi:conserved Plasmodium protein, unknown function [Plasmodium malariae]|uniref:AATF leucine zipper-containing domain-containing protein n=1 Tax=Plasmodium malariae TaxID=5858 RepID=A0A1C3KE93_PLAMA|nr:conserved Plasmodium protein, unknown function [Plasmodium malariae]